MSLLDTNEGSELMRPFPNPAVEKWIADRPIAEADHQVAAITPSGGMALTTRNFRDSEDTGADVPGPWASS